MIVTEWKSQFPAHFEARTLLNPFFRLYHSVTVQVRTEVTMPADTDIVPKAFQELMHKQPERRALFRRTGIFGTPPDIKTALIADAYRVRIMALGMRPDKFQSTGIDYRAILTDVVVIADTAEATATVIFLQFGHSQRTVFACGEAHDDSDWDVLVLSPKEKLTFKEEEQFMDHICDVIVKTGQAIQLFAYGMKDWHSRHSITPFYQNVQSEAVLL